MEQWLIQFSSSHQVLVYAAIIILSCIEGPIISILLGVLMTGGYFGFFPAYAAVIAGDVVGDSVWYWVGKRYGHAFIGRFGRHLGITEAKVEKAKQIFHRHRDWIMIVSKMTNGFGLSLVSLLTAGMMRMPFGRYLGLNLIGQLFWSGFLIALGYFFGTFFGLFDKVLGRFGTIGLVVLIVVGLFITYRAVEERIAKKF
ncbi:MAG: DedA family protein [Candidatus Paceibacterota bacterium]|jgi:membrane protein DedA with SNARE-associated domain